MRLKFWRRKGLPRNNEEVRDLVEKINLDKIKKKEAWDKLNPKKVV